KPLNASQYAYLLNEALQNDGKSPFYNYEDYKLYQNHTDPYLHPDINWSDELLKSSAISQSYNLNVSGGGKVAQYFISLGYLNEQGLFKTDDSNGYNTNLNFNRYLISSKVNINITDDFTATMTAIGRIEEGNQPGGTGSGYSDLLLNIYQTANNAYPIYNPDGSWGGSMSNQNNLMSQTINSGYMSDNSRDISASLKLNYDFSKLVEGLSAHAIGSISTQNRTAIIRTKRAAVYQYKVDENGNPVYTMYGSNSPQSNDFRDIATYQQMYGQFAVDYKRRFGLHGLHASLMGDTRHEVDDYDLPSLPSNIMESVKYDYDQRYFAQLAVTQSYYNRYAPGNRWGNFFAVGLGWDIAREKFMENVDWVNKLKLRAVYGNTGNGVNNSGYYIWRQTYSDQGTSYYPFGVSMSNAYRFVTENGLANPYITWEKAHKVNIGLDASFFNDRLAVTFDYYNDKYYDLLQTRGKSIELLGTSYPAENIGKSRRSGTELTLTWQDNVGTFNYYVTGNWSVEYSKLLFMDEQRVEYDYQRQTGRTLGTQFGLIADGFLTAEDIANGYPVMNGWANKVQPGDVKYKDLNEDGVIDEYDKAVIGGDKPKGYFGIDLGFEWKGLEFSMFWQGCYNRDLYVSDRTLVEGFQSINGGYGQAYQNILNRWTPETAATATYPRLSAGGNTYNYGGYYGSSLWMHSGNYIRLKNISLAYNLPAAFCRDHLGGVRVKVFFNAQNLLTFSACDLVDPEVTFTSSPLQRCIFTGINLNF
ncbi:MAG: SusC/RagA family TonB-linked outer membrane protein, partial [Prevotella sp.]